MAMLSTQLTAGITYLCVSVAGTPQYNDACNKVAEASTKQVGIYHLLDDNEQKTMTYATNLANDTLGHTTMSIGGVGAFLFRAYRDKSITLKIPTLGIADSINSQLTLTTYKLNLTWRF